MILTLMAEGEVMESVIIDKMATKDLPKYIDEYNTEFGEWFDYGDLSQEFPSLLEWLDREKNITTGPIEVGVISMTDGYWYT